MSESISIDFKYSVHGMRDQSYRLTIPKTIINEFIPPKTTNFRIKVAQSNGNAHILFTNNNYENYPERKLNRSRGTIRVPSNIGSALELKDTEVTWKADKRENNINIIARTSRKLESVDTSELDCIRKVKFPEDKTGNFDVYINENDINCLGWNLNTELSFSYFLNENNEVCLRISDYNSVQSKKTKLNRIDNENMHSRIYVPKDLVNSCDLNSESNVYIDNSSLIIC